MHAVKTLEKHISAREVTLWTPRMRHSSAGTKMFPESYVVRYKNAINFYGNSGLINIKHIFKKVLNIFNEIKLPQ